MHMHDHNCPVPDCPENDPKWPKPEPFNPNCICNKPMLLYIPPGQHIHCPVHPQHVIHGSHISM